MKYLFLILCLMIFDLSVGQASLSVDKMHILIGDQVRATVTLAPGGGGTWINKMNIWPDSLKGIEVVSGPDTAVSTLGEIQATWTLSFFDTGYVRIPKLPLALKRPDRIDTIYTLDIPIKVEAVEPDSAGLLAIKDIYIQPFSVAYYKHYIPHLVGVLILMAALIYWWKKRKAKAPVPVFTPPPLAPHEWAYLSLEELEAERLWQKGEVKEHYSRLTAVLRGYLERRFKIHALEQTSDEIITQLQRLELSRSTLMDTESLLSIADLIKFAKADPGVDIHAEAITRVKAFVRETTMAALAESQEQPIPKDEGMA